MMKEDSKLQGLCKECTHRKSCQDAKRHLNMTGCSEYKHWKKRTVKENDPLFNRHLCRSSGDGGLLGVVRDLERRQVKEGLKCVSMRT